MVTPIGSLRSRGLSSPITLNPQHFPCLPAYRHAEFVANSFWRNVKCKSRGQDCQTDLIAIAGSPQESGVVANVSKVDKSFDWNIKNWNPTRQSDSYGNGSRRFEPWI